jgi:hypothetical protein
LGYSGSKVEGTRIDTQRRGDSTESQAAATAQSQNPGVAQGADDEEQRVTGLKEPENANQQADYSRANSERHRPSRHV